MHLKLAETARGCSNLSIALSAMLLPGWDSLAFGSNSFHVTRFGGLRCASSCKPALAHALYEWRARAGSLSLQQGVSNALPGSLETSH